MERNDEPRLAVLIDADNTAPKWAEAIFEEIATLGEASVRRIYGDFSGPYLRSWEKKLAGLAVIPISSSRTCRSRGRSGMQTWGSGVSAPGTASLTCEEEDSSERSSVQVGGGEPGRQQCFDVAERLGPG